MCISFMLSCCGIHSLGDECKFLQNILMLLLQGKGFAAEQDQSLFMPLMLAVTNSEGNTDVDMTSISVLCVIFYIHLY